MCVGLGALAVTLCPALLPALMAAAPYLLGIGAFVSGWQIGIGVFGVDVWTGQSLTMGQRGWYIGSGIVGAGASFYGAVKYDAAIGSQFKGAPASKPATSGAQAQ